MADALKINSKNCPVGTFIFCAVTGVGILNQDSEIYEFKVTLEYDESDLSALMDEIDGYIDDNAPTKGTLTKLPYQTNEDYEGIPKGKIWLYAKAAVEREDRKTGDMVDRIITIYDSRGEKVSLPEGTGVGQGSTGKLFGNMTVWERKKEYGATIWLTGVQIGDFIPYEFEEEVEVMEGGSFKGFNTPQLQKDEDDEDETTSERPSRRPSRRSNTNKDETTSERPSRRPSRRG